MGRLSSLSFGRYNLNEDFLSFLKDFTALADAYASPKSYQISHFRSCLVGDAKDLFESRVDAASLGSWFQVQQLVKKLFVPTDQRNVVWDFLASAKFKTIDNLDLHFSKFVKNAKPPPVMKANS